MNEVKKLVKSFTDDGYTLDNSDPHRVILYSEDLELTVKIERCMPAIRNNSEEFLSRKYPGKYPTVYEYSDDFRVLYCDSSADWSGIDAVTL